MIRVIDQDQTEFSVTALEVSDGESLENFITIWFHPGQEDGVWEKIGHKLWENPEDKFRHDPPIFHSDDHDSKWSNTRHHYHVPYNHKPTKQDVMDLIELLNSVKKCVSPKLIKFLEGNNCIN